MKAKMVRDTLKLSTLRINVPRRNPFLDDNFFIPIRVIQAAQFQSLEYGLGFILFFHSRGADEKEGIRAEMGHNQNVRTGLTTYQ